MADLLHSVVSKPPIVFYHYPCPDGKITRVVLKRSPSCSVNWIVLLLLLLQECLLL